MVLLQLSYAMNLELSAAFPIAYGPTCPAQAG
jgi:hypothetical protein